MTGGRLSDDKLGPPARACGNLPLALRIAGAHLADRRDMSIEAYFTALRTDPTGALAVAGDSRSSIRAAFDLSFRRLPEPAGRLFRLVGAGPQLELTVSVAAALAAEPPERPSMSLTTLAGAHLIPPAAPGRYIVHDLLHGYAANLAATEGTADDGRTAVRPPAD